MKLTGTMWLLLVGLITIVGVVIVGDAIRGCREKALIEAEQARDRAARTSFLMRDFEAADADAEDARRDAEWRSRIVRLADTRTKIDALTADESWAAVEDAKAIMGQFEQLEEHVVIRAVGMLSKLGLSRDDLVDAAILIQAGRLEFNRRMGGEWMVRLLKRTRKNSETFVDEWRRRETRQEGDEG